MIEVGYRLILGDIGGDADGGDDGDDGSNGDGGGH